MTASACLTIKHISNDLSIDRLDDESWKSAYETIVTKQWSGNVAPIGRHFKAQLLWSDTAIYVRFEANTDEPLVVSDKPDLTTKAIGLWDRDVCEIFIAPDKSIRNKYFEFEIAPTFGTRPSDLNGILIAITTLSFSTETADVISDVYSRSTMRFFGVALIPRSTHSPVGAISNS